MDRQDFTNNLAADRAKLDRFVEVAWWAAYKLDKEMKPGGCCEGRLQFHSLVDAMKGVDGIGDA